MTNHHLERARATLRGALHGTGFRAFVQGLARELGLTGWVRNTESGVLIEAEGSGGRLREFLLRIERHKPPRAVIQGLEFSFLDAAGYSSFLIDEKAAAHEPNPAVPPDVAPCPQCQMEMFQPGNRRFRYPFINCANCGPRFSILEDLPYERANTSMKEFEMCALCRREYEDPSDRRYHTEPNACPSCGPHVEFWDPAGNAVCTQEDALHHAAEDIRAGKIIAVKGPGGFQLICDARSEPVVQRLRTHKRRTEKPLALMYPSLPMVRRDCHVSELEERLLLSPEAPIVLLHRWTPPLAPSIAPGNPTLGIMLPSSPLHHLLLRELGFPVVATSGNMADEPICTDEHEALTRLEGIADFFLVHNRPVVRPLDDSIVRVVRGREMVLRRARGYAPLPVRLLTPAPRVLAVGADLKNTVAFGLGAEAFISPHVGDLESTEAQRVSHAAADDLPRFFDTTPEVIACELDRDALSTKFAIKLAEQTGARLQPVQHHVAHMLACMVENEVPYPALGVIWDGTNRGPDGTLWGGEFLLARENGFERVAHLRPFRLPGVEASSRQPRRAAMGALDELDEVPIKAAFVPESDFPESELAQVRQMLDKKTDAPLTSSAGRLFEAVASLAGLRQRASHEGQAAMDLEFAIHSCVAESYKFEVKSTAPSIIDWRPALEELLTDVQRGSEPGVVAAKFHNTMVEVIIAIAKHVGQTRVVLSGGCFQNRYLTERAVQRLISTGFRPYWHQRVPPNDGGIALGQVVYASRPRPPRRDVAAEIRAEQAVVPAIKTAADTQAAVR
jgi:hydrogenase maturation protein HypF